MLNSGGYAGPAIGTLLLGWVASFTDWRWSFYVAGGLCLLWLLAWLAWYRKPEDANFIGEDERRLLLRERRAMIAVAHDDGGRDIARLCRLHPNRVF